MKVVMTQEQKYNLALALISQGVTNLNDVQNFIDGLDLNHEKVSAKGSVWVGSEDKSDGNPKEAQLFVDCYEHDIPEIITLLKKYGSKKGYKKIEVDKSI